MTTTAHTIAIWARQTGKTNAINKARAVMQVPALRACALCMHSAVPPGATDMACLCPVVVAIHGSGATAAVARAGQGACGPDARHLDMHSWQQHRRQQQRDTVAA